MYDTLNVTTLSMAQQSPRAMKELQQDLAQSLTQSTSGQKASLYTQVPEDTWSLLSAASESESSAHLVEVCAQHAVHARTFQGKLNHLASQLISLQKDIMVQSGVTTFEPDLTAFQDSVKQWARGFADTLNASFEGVGHLFSGAQTDLRPVNPELIDRLCADGGPDMAISDIPLYFLYGYDTAAELPLTLYTDSNGQHLDLPLQANQMQDVFVALHDVLSIRPPMTPNAGLVGLQNALDPALMRVQDAQGATANVLRSLEGVASSASADQAEADTYYEQLTAVNPVETALDISHTQQRIETWFQYCLLMENILIDLNRLALSS